jgi:hypothetical protein
MRPPKEMEWKPTCDDFFSNESILGHSPGEIGPFYADPDFLKEGKLREGDPA